MHLFIGSQNPVKVNAVTIAASETWPEVVVVGYDVPSGIAGQPMSDAETRQGAINRARAALKKGLQESAVSLALGVGLEGGVFKQDNEVWSTVWIAVIDAQGNLFESNGARFKVPSQIADPIIAGEEMGVVIGRFFGDPLTKQKQGAIGVITQNFVDRTEEYTGIVKMALGLWYGRNWHTNIQKSN
jgi:inosine/xanthosine triphosphatase